MEGPLAVGIAALDTLFTDQDAAYIDDPCTVRRTVFVPTDNVSSVDFDIDDRRRALLHGQGVTAAHEFLAGWDFESYLASCRPPGERLPPAPDHRHVG